MAKKTIPKFKVGQTVYISDTFHENILEDIVANVTPSDSQDHNLYRFNSKEHYSNYYEIDVFGNKEDACRKHIAVMTNRLIDNIKDANRCIRAIRNCGGTVAIENLLK